MKAPEYNLKNVVFKKKSDHDTEVLLTFEPVSSKRILLLLTLTKEDVDCTLTAINWVNDGAEKSPLVIVDSYVSATTATGLVLVIKANRPDDLYYLGLFRERIARNFKQDGAKFNTDVTIEA